MTPVPVIFVYRDVDGDTFNNPITKKHAMLPALPAVGDLVIPPGEIKARAVRAREWDCSQGNGSNATIHIALD